MASDLPALIARVEAATGADYDIDREIWRAVDPDAAEEYAACETPAYTAGLDAAVALVPSGWGWSVGGWADDGFTNAIAVVSERRKFMRPQVHAATPALALCLAALRARQAQEGGGHG
jgi:hypothetical protein